MRGGYFCGGGAGGYSGGGGGAMGGSGGGGGGASYLVGNATNRSLSLSTTVGDGAVYITLVP